MNRNQFRITYDIVTHESAEQGDSAEQGYFLPGGWKVPTADAIADTAGDYGWDLRNALTYLGGVDDCGSWFRECDSDIDYRTGEYRTLSLHPPENITASSYRRLARLLKA